MEVPPFEPVEIQPSRLKRFFFQFCIAFTAGALSGLLSWHYFYRFKAGSFKNIRPPSCKEVLGTDGKVARYSCPFRGVRLWRPLSQIDPKLRRLVVLTEDAKFYAHEGFDVEGIKNAIEEDIEKKKFAKGGSTITQQLAKNLFLTKEKSLFRKASEVPITVRIEEELSKSQILELYLNTIEWGPGVYGAEAASRLYFDHPAAELTDDETWLLALMIPNPIELCLWTRPRAKKSILHRAKQLSRRLAGDKVLTREDAKLRLENFTAFIEIWALKRPSGEQVSERVFPAAWSPKY